MTVYMNHVILYMKVWITFQYMNIVFPEFLSLNLGVVIRVYIIQKQIWYTHVVWIKDLVKNFWKIMDNDKNTHEI